jgi:hypothetical protein
MNKNDNKFKQPAPKNQSQKGNQPEKRKKATLDQTEGIRFSRTPKRSEKAHNPDVKIEWIKSVALSISASRPAPANPHREESAPPDTSGKDDGS